MIMKIRIFLLAALICLLPSPGLGQEGGGKGMHGGMGRGPGWALRQLDLSEAQKQALACETPGEGREMRQAMQLERKKLNQMIRDKNVPDDAIYAQLDAVNKARAAWDQRRLQKMLKARSVLTDEQMEKLLTLQEEGGR